MNQAPQMPRRASQLPSSPSHVIMLLIGQSQKRYAAIKEMLKNQVAGFADLQKESNQLALLYMQEDGGPDSQRIHRLALSLQAVFAAAEINGQDLHRHLQAELFLQGELNRFQMGKPPTHFQGPQSPQAQQPIVPGYQPPPQLGAPGAQAQAPDGAQQAQAPQQSYFRPGPNGLEPSAAFAVPQQPPQPQQPQMMPQQPQMPFPMPGYAMPPGYPQQPPMQQPMQAMPQMPQMPTMPQMPQMPPQVLQGQPMYPPQAYAQPQYPQAYPQAPYGYYAPPQAPPASMPVNHLPVMQQGQDPNAQPVLMPLMPQQQPMPQQQFATPEAARQAMMPDAPPPPAVPVGVVHFPMPNALHDSQANGAAQPKQ